MSPISSTSHLRIRLVSWFAAFVILTASQSYVVAASQLRFPSKPAGSEVRQPVPLKTERSVVPDGSSIRLLVVGDVGIRDGGWDGATDMNRKRVAERARQVCTEKVCDLLVLLGDNLYEKGIRRKHQREDEEALAGIVRTFLPDAATPVYIALGNHDWGLRSPKHATADRQLRWIGSEASLDLRGNAHFYNFEAGPVGIWILDTNYLVRNSSPNRDPDLLSWLNGIASSDSDWKIVVGHHPIRSNGEHGNAGAYREPPIPFSIWAGKAFARLLRDTVEGKADLYLAGHEHNLQFLSEVSLDGAKGTATAVIGSGAKCKGPGKKRHNPGMELELYNYGFAIVEATQERLAVTFHIADRDGWTRWTAGRDRGAGWQAEKAPPATNRACREADTCCPPPP